MSHSALPKESPNHSHNSPGEIDRQLATQIEQQKALAGVITRIRASLDLDTIFHTTATEVRQLLQTDRVAVFRFDPKRDWEGEFIAEDVDSRWDSAMAAKVYDHCFGVQFAPQYEQGRISGIADIYEANLSECHIEILARFQVRANLVAPLIERGQLWGLLCIHQCRAPRNWSDSDTEFVRQIAENLSVALEHIELLASARTHMEQQKALAGVIARIRASLDLENIFQTMTAEVRTLLQTDRVAVFRFDPERDWEGEFIAEDVDPQWNSAMAAKVYDRNFGEKFAPHFQQGCISAMADIYEADLSEYHIEILDRFQVRANIVAPLIKEGQLWGLLCIHQCRAPRNWSDSDTEFVRQIAENLSVALEHIELLASARTRMEQQKALAGVIARIRASLDLDTIFQTTATEVRRLLQADRVGVFRFYPERDWEGEFIAEDVDPQWDSAIAKKVYDHCFSDRFAPQYQQGRINAISDIYQREFSDCYLEILAQFQVRANVVAPLLKGEMLWGLLCIHQCEGPRSWRGSEVEFIRQIAEQLGVALQQAEYIDRVRLQSSELVHAQERQKAAERQKALSKTIDRIRQSLNIESIFQTSTQEVLQMLRAERVAIYRFSSDRCGEFVAESMTEGWRPVVGMQPALEDLVGSQPQNGEFDGTEALTVNDCDRLEPTPGQQQLLERLEAKAYAIAPIFQGENLWGLLATYQNTTSRTWEASEVNLLAQIASHLGVALQQAEYIQRTREQSLQLTRASELQKALSTTVDKIRQSLDIKAIFETTTQEVRQLLEVERVAIYRFNPDWSGGFVADSIVDGWTGTATAQIVPNPMVWEQAREGRYPRNETFVPILQGEKLWGLLVAYQNSQPRYWEDEEINLLAQVGVQLGVALQQAELLEQTRSQKEELTQALAELQATQAQLIQGEKMAGLGQLVAGVAHEINNPVNFIFGNLSHMSQYVEDLFAAIELYDRFYPQPVPELGERLQELELDFLAVDLPKVLASMKLGANRIRDIVLSLRTFSRIDEAQMKPVDLHEGIDSTLLILQYQLKDKGHLRAIEVEKDYGELPLVECYAAQLNQVLMNLLSNAIDALEEKRRQTDRISASPRIRICTKAIGDRVRIGITDNGSGIPETVRSRLFDPFFTTKEPGKGTGLGLSISYQIIVEHHGGQLQCQPLRDGGTEFILEIPMAASDRS